MRKRSWFNRSTGLCDLAIKQGDRPKDRKNLEAKNRVKDFCLTCEKPDCDGCRGKVFTKHQIRDKY